MDDVLPLESPRHPSLNPLPEALRPKKCSVLQQRDFRFWLDLVPCKPVGAGETGPFQFPSLADG